MDEETRKEKARKTCALRYLDGYPDTKVIDPIKENYPARTMPLSATTPLHVTPEILCNTQYAQEYVEHVALIRELLDQASLSTNPDLLQRSSNRLLRSLGGLLRGASDCESTREPIPVWSLVKVVRSKPDAELVRQTTTFMGDAHAGRRCHSIDASSPSHSIGWKQALLHEGRSHTSLDKEGTLQILDRCVE